MKRSKWLILAIVVAASSLLLWIWIFVSYNRIIDPLDYVFASIWLTIVTAGVIAIWGAEQTRRRRIRTIYVSPKVFYNTEAGLMPYIDSIDLVSEYEQVLDSLDYRYEVKDFPNTKLYPTLLVIRSKKYKNAVKDTPSKKKRETRRYERLWKGKVIVPRTNEEHAFEGRNELMTIIDGLRYREKTE